MTTTALEAPVPLRAVLIDSLGKPQFADRCSIYTVTGPDGVDHRLAVPDLPDLQLDALHHCQALTRRALGALGTLDGARRAAHADQSLSPLGRDLKLAPVRADVAKVVERVQADLETFGREVDVGLAQAYAPPPIEAGDIVGALHDQEIRAHLHALAKKSPAQAAGVMAGDPRLAAAILRSPYPQADLETPAREVWRRHVEASNPHIARMRDGLQAHAWASSVVAEAARLV